MLYDKRWEKPEIKADPFSLDSLIEWLEKQPADKPYCYMDNGHCLLGQYFTAMGFRLVAVGGSDFDHETERGVIFPEKFNDVAYGDLQTFDFNRTFGAALKRARAYLRSPEVTKND
jgi:hypothetical protein